MTLEDTDRPSLTEIAYHGLREGILLGRFAPGQKLVVNELVDEWKISNTPIKEALNRLVAEGLVEALPRRGMRVRIYGTREMWEIFELRTLYEVYCCRLAVATVSANRAALEVLIQIQNKSLEIFRGKDNHIELFALDEQFHLNIVKLCGNDTMIKEFNRLHANTLAIGIHANKHDPMRRREEAIAEHGSVLLGLMHHSEEEAAEAIHLHLENTAKDLLGFFRKESGRAMVVKSPLLAAKIQVTELDK